MFVQLGVLRRFATAPFPCSETLQAEVITLETLHFRLDFEYGTTEWPMSGGARVAVKPTALGDNGCLTAHATTYSEFRSRIRELIKELEAIDKEAALKFGRDDRQMMATRI